MIYVHLQVPVYARIRSHTLTAHAELLELAPKLTWREHFKLTWRERFEALGASQIEARLEYMNKKKKTILDVDQKSVAISRCLPNHRNRSMSFPAFVLIRPPFFISSCLKRISILLIFL